MPARPEHAREDVADRLGSLLLPLAHRLRHGAIWPAATRTRSSPVNSDGMSLSRGTASTVCPSPLPHEQIAARAPSVERRARRTDRRAGRAATRPVRSVNVDASSMRSAIAALRCCPAEPNDRRSRGVPSGPVIVIARSSRCGPACVSPRRRSSAALLLERRGERCDEIVDVASSVLGVAHAHAGRFADVAAELLERVLHRPRPSARRSWIRAARRARPAPAPRRRRSPPIARAGSRALAQRRVAPRQRAPVALQRGEIPARREREHDVEKAATRAGRAGDQLDVGGREQHRRKRAECIAQALGDVAVEAHALSLSRALESDADFVAARPCRRWRRCETRRRRSAPDPGRARRAPIAESAGSRSPRAGSSCPGRSRR